VGVGVEVGVGVGVGVRVGDGVALGVGVGLVLVLEDLQPTVPIITPKPRRVSNKVKNLNQLRKTMLNLPAVH
jgi:hypothetical protein